MESVIVRAYSAALAERRATDARWGRRPGNGEVHLVLREARYRPGPGRPTVGRKMIVYGRRYADQLAAAARRDMSGDALERTTTHLLLYVAQWRFTPSETTIRLARRSLCDRPPAADAVFLVFAVGDAQADARILYPFAGPGEPDDVVLGDRYVNVPPEEMGSDPVSGKRI